MGQMELPFGREAEAVRRPDCRHPNARPIIPGERFHRLTVVSGADPILSPVKGRIFRRRAVLVECRCGKRKVVQFGLLVLGNPKSCGCHASDRMRERNTIHGWASKRPENRAARLLFMIWHGMRRRCSDSRRRQFKDYGGRGIRVCEEWSQFPAFLEWATANGFSPGLSIERKDVNGHYCPGNCCWIPMREQSKNRRATVWVSAFGETKCLEDWARDPRCGVTSTTILDRMAKGWTPEQAISIPSQRQKSSRRA